MLFNENIKREIIENAKKWEISHSEEEEQCVYESKFSLAGYEVIAYILTINDTVKECVENWVSRHRKGNKLCVTGNMQVTDWIPTGPNIIQIISRNY